MPVSRPSLVQRLSGATEVIRGWTASPLGQRLGRWVNALLSLLILLLLVRAIAQVGWQQVVDVVPANPWFWLVLVAGYLFPPLLEWLIYRRWWHLDTGAIGVFLKMRVMNDALFSYSGHTYLLVWASKYLGVAFDPANPPRVLGRGGGPGVDPAQNPVAAVKDMAITSGIAGVLATLVLLLLALGLSGADAIRDTLDPRTLTILGWSFGAMILLNFGIVLFRHDVMTLPVRENMIAFGWHLVRVLGVQALLVASWAVALPGTDAETWFVLGAFRMVVMRMPVPNKEVLFAAIAVGLAGDGAQDVAALMAAQGALHLVFHAVAWGVAAVMEGRKPVASDAA
jgi:hypothetical protein